ncbi:carbon-phosphorus lyase complex subunit PhnI [Sedimentibacter sp. MB31-C6]|uniref:carbon-phosphorus lyase complex subunit PhnI n=1 Tax=Sedimentibacter sp. MB31-C6 TaxID=3109366 RepID=UPI002DDD10D4|nr:carbon-phosphorus lyase complex subunit PhnI [Sedimentibacter sp. MB36-C1]WSI03622.1 carbon-phosphorus lyase complex subunit PhnI [Sedimentibacter sp. MB36-C1]
MAYVAVAGGQEAIEESIKLLKYYRTEGNNELEIDTIKDKMKLLVDRVMSEAGFYAPDYAALALKQCEGSLEEAVFLIRAYRSTLSRNYYSNTVYTENMRIIRRISAAFKDIPGGQILGPTYDYTHRLLNFDIINETKEEKEQLRKSYDDVEYEDITFTRVSDLLRNENLLEDTEDILSKPFDVTLNNLTFPAPRSAILQTMARADTGYISGLAYSSLRGFGSVHPTVGELRTGWVSVEVPYMLSEGESIYVGEILVTEVESFVSASKKTNNEHDEIKVGIGYGCVFGRNETKAISMSILDRALKIEGDSPVNDEEFVLLHGDSLEMNGFLSHLKLPHYVTFQSKLDQLRKKKGE